MTYDYKIKNLHDSHLVDVLIISFHGVYRNGSAGRPDAGLIKGSIAMGQSVYDPFAIIIDFSDFEYNWGDNLDLSFDEVGSVKTVIIVGDKCRRGMSTLTYGIDTNKDIVDDVFFFDNFDKALEKLER